MKKLAVVLFSAIMLVTSFSVSTAFAGNVNISFNGSQQVKKGTTYNFSYNITMSGSYQYIIQISCDNAQISGSLNPSFDNLCVNTDNAISSSFSVKISDAAAPGDTINIKAKGAFAFMQEDGNSISGNISETYTLTVVADELPTPSPQPTPEPTPEPIPAPPPAATPTPAPAATPAPAPTTPRATEKPLNFASPAAASASPSSSPSPSSSQSPSSSPSSSPSPSSSQSPSSSPSAGQDGPSASALETAAGWDALILDLDMMAQGGTITASMESVTTTTLPAQALKALKAKQGTLVVNFDSYSCLIDGTKLGVSLTEPVDLKMTMTQDTAESDAADRQDIYQLHFAQTGDLPGCFIYSLESSNSRPGDAVYLYFYHDASGVAEYKQSAVVNENGCAAFDIYEGGSYFVTAALIGGDTPVEPNPLTGQADETSDDFWMILIPVICVVSITAAAFIRHKRTNKKAPNKQA